MKKPVLSVEHSGRRSVRQVVADVLPFYSLIVRVLGSIYTGIATPTEAAALGCLLALVVCRFWVTSTGRR
jgi:TRAP-type mannitol/chloroaromatic compound transport system permease large subunit